MCMLARLQHCAISAAGKLRKYAASQSHVPPNHRPSHREHPCCSKQNRPRPPIHPSTRLNRQRPSMCHFRPESRRLQYSAHRQPCCDPPTPIAMSTTSLTHNDNSIAPPSLPRSTAVPLPSQACTSVNHALPLSPPLHYQDPSHIPGSRPSVSAPARLRRLSITRRRAGQSARECCASKAK